MTQRLPLPLPPIGEIGTFSLGNVNDELNKLFLAPNSLWDQIKADAITMMVDEHVREAITQDTDRMEIVFSHIEKRLKSPTTAKGFRQIYDWTKARSLIHHANRTITYETLTELVVQLKLMANYSNRYTDFRYLSSDGIGLVKQLIIICEWLLHLVKPTQST